MSQRIAVTSRGRLSPPPPLPFVSDWFTFNFPQHFKGDRKKKGKKIKSLVAAMQLQRGGSEQKLTRANVRLHHQPQRISAL